MRRATLVLAMLIAGCSIDAPDAAAVADATAPDAAAAPSMDGVVLSFVGPPEHVQVGQSVQLAVQATREGTETECGPLQFGSSDTSVATVSDQGAVVGRAPGRVYITASTDGAEALLELDVR